MVRLAISILVVILTSRIRAGTPPGAAYYVDCARGDDSADARTPSTAWRTLARIAKHSFQPGDSILLKRGTTCEGMFTAKGSGREGASITLGAWGEGPLPRIQSDPGREAALKLFNQEYWNIESVELIGGQPHGLFISGNQGVLHQIRVSNIVVHDVTGEPKAKEGGLLVISPGSVKQRFDDVVVDGATAYGTSQWAGILVGGGNFGYPPESTFSTNVVVRNSLVHDVQGDGIILFRIKKGLIENSVTWNTGMQDTETIGTPNAIWTWMCRDCIVQRNEAFLSDSPGVDGGAFDIDYGNVNNTVQDNYGHDTQGYCVAVFGAGWTTINSLVRNNVCADNGRSPRLARRQGAIYLSTWNRGKLQGLRIDHNRVEWHPAIDAPALVNGAAFVGSGWFEDNLVLSSAPSFMDSNGSLKLDRNSYEYTGEGAPVWRYASRLYTGFHEYQEGSGQDAHGTNDHARSDNDPAPAENEGFPALQLRNQEGRAESLSAFAGKWLLLGFVSQSPEDAGASRAQVTLLESVQEQFRSSGLEVILIAEDALSPEAAGNLACDWNLGRIPLLMDTGRAALKACRFARTPSMVLVNPAREIAWRREGLALPAELGLRMRSAVGRPRYQQIRGPAK